ncbi:hypothetical protein BN975_00132 [Mycolicibacterium farcinogenes]|nr:hypothetical protein BN975_00132 [Mycolicibacterium farcinogenes]
MGFALAARPAQAFQDARAGGLPEACRIEQFHQEEETAAGLHLFAHLTEQVGLAGARRAANHHAQWAGVGFPYGVAEGGHDIGHRPVVKAAHVQCALRMPEIVGSGRPGQTKRAERFAVR